MLIYIFLNSEFKEIVKCKQKMGRYQFIGQEICLHL